MIDALKKLIFSALRGICTTRAKWKLGAYGIGLTVNFPCAFTRTTQIGKYCHFNGMKVRGAGRLVIGDHFHSGEDILVLTQNHNYNRPTMLPYDNADRLKDVIIGAFVWVGSRAILLPGSHLGDGCVVQAGAVVGGSFPANAVVGGNPARIIRYRDTDVVARLVSEGKFLH